MQQQRIQSFAGLWWSAMRINPSPRRYACSAVAFVTTVFVTVKHGGSADASPEPIYSTIPAPGLVGKSVGPTCPAQWAQGFHTPIAQGVASLAVFDDGSGSALFVGGEFDGIWDTWARTIAKWDGTSWHAFPQEFGYYEPFIGDVPYLNSMIVFDDGTGPALFVAGCFATVGELDAKNIAKWDGRTWSSLGRALMKGVRAVI